MDLFVTYSMILLVVCAVLFLEQTSVSYEPQAMEALDPKSEMAFYKILLKLLFYFGFAVSYLGVQTFFEDKRFLQLSKRVQVLSLCLWNLSFVFVPLMFLSFLQINSVYMIIGLFALWLVANLWIRLLKVKSVTVRLGIVSAVLPLIFAREIQQGLSSLFMSEVEPSELLLLMSQRGSLVVLGFFICGIVFSFFLHRSLRKVLQGTWLVPLSCLFFVSTYTMSLSVAMALVAADRIVLAYTMSEKMRELSSKLTREENNLYVAVVIGSAMLFWLVCFFVPDMLLSSPDASSRVLTYSSALLGMQMIIFLSTMVWGHFTSRSVASVASPSKKS